MEYEVRVNGSELDNSNAVVSYYHLETFNLSLAPKSKLILSFPFVFVGVLDKIYKTLVLKTKTSKEDSNAFGDDTASLALN